jgi:hypothetical protein
VTRLDAPAGQGTSSPAIVEALRADGPLSGNVLVRRLRRRRAALLAELRALVEAGTVEAVGRGPNREFRIAQRSAATPAAPVPPPAPAAAAPRCVYHAPPDQGGLGWTLRVPGACAWCEAASR